MESPNLPRRKETIKKTCSFSEKIKTKFLPWQARPVNLLDAETPEVGGQGDMPPKFWDIS